VLDCPDTIEPGLKLQSAEPAHESVIDPVKPLCAVAETVKVAVVLPTNVVTTGVEDDRENTAEPVADKAAVCGLPVAVSLTLRVPESAPLPVGAKTILAEQLWPTARVLFRARQVFVSVKLPVTLIELMFTVEVPVFVMVTVWGALTVPTAWGPKVKVVGESVTDEDVVTPVPVRAMLWGLLLALSVSVS
jgi:hypothetical protein